MKTNLDYLPESKQHIIAEIRRVILNEVEEFTQSNRDKGYIVWLVLFGSYARGTYVDNLVNGYISDYDILVGVHNRKLADNLKLWHKVEDKIERLTCSPINLIVHGHGEILHCLQEGHYFFSDIRKEGIYLYASNPKKGLPEPKLLTNEERLLIAQKHYKQWFESVDDFLDTYQYDFQKGKLKKAAFELHQAVERFYACTLLVLSNYRPRTHSIKNLRNMTITMTSPESPLSNIFAGKDKFQRRCFERLKRAYIDSRYSEHYDITQEELSWLAEEVQKLKDITRQLCQLYINDLRSNSLT